MLLALKVDVDTYRGTREGVANLARLLQRHGANASFLFSVGPDHTGWALRRMFRRGFLHKVARTSVIGHYGWKTLMYGVLLPAPDIGKACAGDMRAIKAAGFECGIHSWDHVLWQDHVRQRDASWTRQQMQQAVARFTEIFGTLPATHGAAGWQMNLHAFAQLDAFGFHYASDGRCRLTEQGTPGDPDAGPHRVAVLGKTLSCIQLPTTLPTLDELLGRTIDGRMVDAANVAATLLALTAAPRDHVFTLHAELEGQKLAPAFDRLLTGWRAQGYELVSLGDYFERVRHQTLPISAVRWGCLPGRSGEVIMQAESANGIPGR